MRIILVDDHEFLRDGLRARLSRSAGIEVVGEAGTASEGARVIAETRPDLVLLDLGLPDKTGIELTTEIRAAWPKIKIIVLTGDRNEAATSAAVRAGADGFILKEDAAAELLRAIPVVMAGQAYLSPSAATAVAGALRHRAESKESPRGPQLTERERAVLRGLAEGRSYKDIAASLQVGARTVETYRARLVRKLDCKDRAELVRCAVRLGLVQR